MAQKIELKVTNYDKNGNVIKDLSKLVVPIELQMELLNRINRNKINDARRR
jgi:hypothetical protein